MAKQKQREEAWKVFPWPCIGEFWFIEQGLLRHPDYARILERLKTDTTPEIKFLDLGTCVGQDIRKLAYDGAPVSTLYGADVLPGFEAAGHSLFQDSDRFDSSHFITGDVFSDIDELAKTRWTWDIVHIAMFLHVFSLSDQETACTNILKLLKPTSGSTIMGTQTGTLDSGDFWLNPPLCEPGEHRAVFRQSKETLKATWEKAASAAGAKVSIWTDYDEDDAKRRAEGKEERFFAGDRERRIFFRVELV